jgi:hypothetical protein
VPVQGCTLPCYLIRCDTYTVAIYIQKNTSSFGCCIYLDLNRYGQWLINCRVQSVIKPEPQLLYTLSITRKTIFSPVHSTPPLRPVMNQMVRIYTLIPSHLRSILILNPILPSHLLLGVGIYLVLSGCPKNKLCIYYLKCILPTSPTSSSRYPELAPSSPHIHIPPM